MFNYILSHYHLQEKDWLCSDPSPVQVGRHFELNVKLTQPATQCTSCQGTKFHRHGTTPHPRGAADRIYGTTVLSDDHN